MSQPKVIILNLKGLYNILLELREFLKFELQYQEIEKDLAKENKGNLYLVISKNKLSKNIDNKNLIILAKPPIKILGLIEKININLLKQKYSSQSNFLIKQYKLDFNSRIMSPSKKRFKINRERN